MMMRIADKSMASYLNFRFSISYDDYGGSNYQKAFKARLFLRSLLGIIYHALCIFSTQYIYSRLG